MVALSELTLTPFNLSQGIDRGTFVLRLPLQKQTGILRDYVQLVIDIAIDIEFCDSSCSHT